MTFTSTLRNRVIVAACAAGTITVGGIGVMTPMTVHTNESLASVSLAAYTSNIATVSLAPAPTWCPLGTRHGKGSGCRGGSINDNERLNQSLKNTGKMYKDAGECAAKGVAKGLTGPGSPSFPIIAGRSLVETAKCGATKPEGKW
jgi:hypothetical protein